MSENKANTAKRPLLHISAPFIGLVGFFIFTALFLWLFNDILLPFVLGAIIAYLLNPLVMHVQKHNRIQRKASILVILGSFLVCLGAILTVLLPLLIQEASQFLNELPTILAKLRGVIDPWIDYAQRRLGITNEQDLKEAIGENVKEAVKASGPVASTIKNIGQSLISVITIPIFTVIIAYFMMNEWPRLSKWTENMIPRPYQETTKVLAKDINKKLE